VNFNTSPRLENPKITNYPHKRFIKGEIFPIFELFEDHEFSQLDPKVFRAGISHCYRRGESETSLPDGKAGSD
jgi:hypothetical protein